MNFREIVMSFKKKIVIGAIAVAAAALSQESMALQAGDNIVYVGGAFIFPSSSIGPLNSTGPAGPTFNATTPGTTATIQNASTPIASLFHMFTDNIAAELTIGVPVKMKIDMTIPNAATSVSDAATTNASFPSIVVKYLFNTPADAFRPFIGLGVNYTYFSSTSANNNALVQELAGSSQSLSSSVNPVFNVGGIYSFTDRWSLNFGISYVPMTSNVSFTGSGPGTGTTTTGKLTINPTDVTVKLGYKF
jgi:outer membrane protein